MPIPVPSSYARPARWVVMGVSGCGKSEVGQRLAQALGVRFLEGDAYHSPANVAKMAAGIPLDDADRADWLRTLQAEIAQAHASGAGLVLACSALKRRYRDRLRLGNPSAGFVFLDLPPNEAAKRVSSRNGHFMPDSLVASQFADLESPVAEGRTLRVDATRSLEAIVDQALSWYASGYASGYASASLGGGCPSAVRDSAVL